MIAAEVPVYRQIWRIIKILVITAFVCWHLFFLLLRNPLDLWWKPISKWQTKQPWWPEVEKPFEKIDYATWYYGCFFGIEQGWSMFGTGVAHEVRFLAVRLHMEDGTTELVQSGNEPNPVSFFRIGGWRQRKLEDTLAWSKPETLAENKDLPLHSAYIRWCVSIWHEEHPRDTRKIVKADLVHRDFQLPGYDQDPSHFNPPTEWTIGTFSPEGDLQ